MDDTPTRGAKRTRRKARSCSPCMPAAWSLVRSNDKKSGVLVCAMGYRTVGTCSNGGEERKDAGVASGWPRTPWGAGGGPRRQAGSVAALSVYRKPKPLASASGPDHGSLQQWPTRVHPIRVVLLLLQTETTTGTASLCGRTFKGKFRELTKKL
jgi:hypothetical protein